MGSLSHLIKIRFCKPFTESFVSAKIGLFVKGTCKFMKKIFARFKFPKNFFQNSLKKPFFKDTISKRCVINFIRTNVMFLFSVLLLSLVTRPLALDIVEKQNINAEVMTSDDTPEEIPKEENPFPFELKKPPEKADRRLTRAEMRWIFKEEIRLNAMKVVINDENARAHKAYSAMVRDFNVRGANFSYELHDKTRAEEDIEAYRDEIAKNAMDEARSYGWGQL